MKFSIIVVCLNPGEKLNQTLDSILMQTCPDYEIVVKDGGSKDGSIEQMRIDERIRLFQEKDTGIYDAMNQAVSHASGDFILFLNCGDIFYDDTVLEKAAEYAGKYPQPKRLVLYGDTFDAKNQVTIASAPGITGFTCYRNIPCHQVCFYSRDLCEDKPYDLKYAIRADYDHFLWCFYEAKARMLHMDVTVASYEGGGFSEKKENQKRDLAEHKQITETYMSGRELFRYKAMMAATMAPLRRFLANNPLFSGIYHWLKECIYHRKKWFLLALLLFFTELALLVWPVGWAREDAVNYLTGEGAWTMETTADNPGFCQEFVPQYDSLKSFSLLFQSMGEGQVLGEASIIISDENDKIVLQKILPYSELNLGSYTEIEADLRLKAGKTYYLNVICSDKEGVEVTPCLCSTEYYMAENKSLHNGSEIWDTQLVTMYHYTDTMSNSKLLKILALCALTALGVAFGLPDSTYLRKGVGILLFILAPYLLGRRLELLTLNTTFTLPFAMKWNVGIMYLLEVIVLLLTCSLRNSVIITNVFLTILYSVNYFVYAFRGVPVRLNDLSAVGTAAQVVDKYNFSPDTHMAMAWCLAVLIVVWAAHTGTKKRKIQGFSKRLLHRIVCLIAGIALAGGAGYQLLYTDLLQEQGFQELHGFDQNMNYHFNGFLVATCIDIQNSRIEKPQGYSVSSVEEILTEASGQSSTSEDLPHVILIMNESFADLRVLGNFQISEENMEFFYSLKENTIRGFTNASVLGGGTANSEFEVFTGCSMGLLPPSYYAYQQCMFQPIDSMISGMESAGYKTISIHPESDFNWNRDEIYQYLGFDESYWKEDFENAEIIHSGASDLETYYKVEELFENREEGEKLFIFDLTMQNHGGYEDSSMEQTVKGVNVSCDEADTFLSLMKCSDEAFAQLIRYFEEEEEKVLICMFGDHQPKFGEESFYDSINSQTEGASEIERLLNQYKTPFVIWANYDIEEVEGVDISMNYLGALLMKTAGIPTSPYFNFLYEQMQEYPIITVNGYLDSEGNFSNWSGDGSEFSKYRMLQYNLLFDADTVEWGY